MSIPYLQGGKNRGWRRSKGNPVCPNLRQCGMIQGNGWQAGADQKPFSRWTGLEKMPYSPKFFQKRLSKKGLLCYIFLKGPKRTAGFLPHP